jgi:hypothetical protein
MKDKKDTKDVFDSNIPSHVRCPSCAALLEGSEGFDSSRGTWRRSGWKELDELRRVCAVCVHVWLCVCVCLCVCLCVYV